MSSSEYIDPNVGGSGGTTIDQYANYAALPTGSLNDLAYVQNTTGIPLINRKKKGLYRKGASSWEFAGDAIQEAQYSSYDNTTSGLTAGTVQEAIDEVVTDLVETITIACSDETTDLTTGTAKVTFRMPFAMTLTDVRASVTTAPTGATLTVDINESGVSVLSTLITIDAGEKTSETAATAPVISDSALANDAEITIDIDQVGSTVAGAGLKVTLIGTRA